MCKNCKKSFVAHFIIIDAEDEENPIDITETYISELTNINIQFEHKYSPHFDKAANKKKYEKIEYMSTEQIMFNIQKNNKLYQSQTNDGKSNKYSVDKKLFISNKILKKLYPNLYYNLLLLFSDNKIRVSNKDDRILVFNIDEFIIDIKKRIKGEINTEDNYFILNETQIRPKDESLEMIRKKKILLENINKVHKIDLTVLKDEKKYDKFQKESQSILVKSQKMLLSLTNSNSQNLSKYLSKDQILYNTNNLIDMNSSVNSSNFFTKKSSNFDINSLNNFNRSKTRELILSHQTSKGEIEFNNFHMTDRNSLNNNEQIPVNNTNYNFFKQSSIGTYTDSQHLNNTSGKRSSSIFGIDKPNLIIPIDYDNVPGKSRKGSRKSIQKYKDIFLKNAK